MVVYRPLLPEVIRKSTSDFLFYLFLFLMKYEISSANPGLLILGFENQNSFREVQKSWKAKFYPWSPRVLKTQRVSFKGQMSSLKSKNRQFWKNKFLSWFVGNFYTQKTIFLHKIPGCARQKNWLLIGEISHLSISSHSGH